jgi:hypothetical protein
MSQRSRPGKPRGRAGRCVLAGARRAHDVTLPRLDYCDKDETLAQLDPAAVFEFEPARIAEGLLAK